MDILEQIERRDGLELPRAYAEWFRGGGPSQPRFSGTDMSAGYLPDLRGWAIELLQECGSPFELPARGFVFAMHQGYQFFYFRCDGDPDPPVWCYAEGDAAPVARWQSFTDFLQAWA